MLAIFYSQEKVQFLRVLLPVLVKMGSLFSFGSSIVTIIVARVIGIKKEHRN